MSFNGIEIDMLSLGDADSILVTQWYGSAAQRVLIDGGNKGNASTVIRFLTNRGIKHIDHVVCTHPHDDHAAGLVSILEDKTISIGKLYMHWPGNHIEMAVVQKALQKASGFVRSQVIQKSLQTVCDLAVLCQQRKIQIIEPFAGAQIGMLTVVGPTLQYYEECVTQFSDSDSIVASEALVSSTPIQDEIEALFEGVTAKSADVLDLNPQTTPENNSSLILGLPHDSGLHLFTGDAGAQALMLAANSYILENCHWMQIPHHGSRRNITEALIAHFRPQTAFVSAAGNVKHPRRSVVNAFKRYGSRVYSTHYPNRANLRHQRGITPTRSGYSTATALYEAVQSKTLV